MGKTAKHKHHSKSHKTSHKVHKSHKTHKVHKVKEWSKGSRKKLKGESQEGHQSGRTKHYNEQGKIKAQFRCCTSHEPNLIRI